MGMFDDLIPTAAQGGPQAPSGGGGGMFDDLIPKRGEGAASTEEGKKEVPLAVRPFVGANRAIADIAGAPVDAVTWGINKLGRGVQALTGEPRKDIITNPIGGSESIKKAMGALPMGGANPDDVRPAATPAEKIAEATGEGVAGMVVPGLSAEALLARSVSNTASFGNELLNIIKGGGIASNAVIGATSGAGGEIAAEVAPEPYKGVARLGGGLAGGVAGALAETGVRAGTGLAKDVLAGVNPNVAGAKKILSASDNPQTLRAAAEELATEGPAVPGSNPNLFQLTGDKKIGELQREVATANPGRHAELLEEQGVARTNALNAVADPEANPQAVGALLRQRLDDIEAQYSQQVAEARKAAQERLGQTGGTQFDNAADYGGGLQKQLDTLDRQRKAAEDRLWESFREAAGDKPINISAFRKDVAEIEGGIGPMAKQPKGEEADILGTIRRAGDFATFKDIGDLRSQITDALRNPQELTGTQRRRLSMVLEKLDGTLDAEVTRVAEEPAARAVLAEKLLASEGAPGIEAHNALQSKAINDAIPTASPPADFRPDQQELAIAQRLVRGWSPEPRVDRPQSLVAFVRRNGGLRMGTPEAAELRAADLGKQPGLLQVQGRQADQLAQAAADAGFVIGKPTRYGSGIDVDGFIKALIEDAGGRTKHFPDTPETAQWRVQQEYFDQFANYLSDIGLNPKGMDAKTVAWIIRQKPEEARFLSILTRRETMGENASLEVARRLDDEIAAARSDLATGGGAPYYPNTPAPTLDELERYYAEYARATSADRTGGQALGGPQVAAGRAPSGGQAASARPSGAGLAQEASGVGPQGLTAEDVALYGAARTATRERKETFGSGAVGDVLQPGDRGGTFGLTQSSVPARLLKRPEDLRAFVAAAGDSPETMALAQDALAFDMRKAAVTKDGLLSPQKLQEWTAKNGEALRQFPDLQAKFANARAAQDTLDTAIANQKAATEAFQTDAVKKFLADKDPHAALEQAMQTPESFRQLVETVKQDPAALAGLKRLAVETIMRKGGVAAEEGALSGVKGGADAPQLAANAVQRFWLNRRPLLGDVFDKAELDNINAVVTDMQRAARTIKIPDSSGTPQDTRAMVMNVIGPWLKNIGGGASGGALLDPTGGVAGAVIGGGAGILKGFYQGRVDRAVADMMLDPRKFAAWAPKVGQASPNEATLGRKMRALLGAEALQGIDSMSGRSP